MSRASSQRVLIVTTEYPSVSQTFLSLRTRMLAERGEDIRVMALRGGESGAGNEPVPTLVGSSPRRVARGLRRVDPSLVHVEFGHLLVRHPHLIPPRPRRLLVSFQGYDICIEGLDAEPGYYAPLWDRIDAAHFPSEDLHRRAVERGMPERIEVEVIPPVFDLERFDPGPRVHTEEAGGSARPVRLLAVGRLHWKKGFEFAIRAVGLLRDRGVASELRILGDGEGRAELEHARSSFDVAASVELGGPVPPDAVREAMGWADVVVLPSVSEGFSCVALESQAMRVPVVASDAEGLSENVLDQTTGFIVPRRDPVALADRVEQLAGSPDLREQLGRAGRERASTLFDPQGLVDRYQALYARLVR